MIEYKKAYKILLKSKIKIKDEIVLAANSINRISTKNILYDFIDKRNRTVVRVGVLLKKKGFINGDLDLSL